MKNKIEIWFLIFCLPIASYSQSGTWNTLLEQVTHLKSTTQTHQDTTKPRQTGPQSNLAVTDEGTPSTTPKADSPQSSGTPDKPKKDSGNPIEKMKKKLTKASTQNNNNGGTTGNLAVTDEGTPSEKGGGKTTGANSTSPNPNQGNTTTVASPK